MVDTLVNDKGERVKLDPPTGSELPPKGFEVKDAGFEAPANNGENIEIKVKRGSKRLQLLKPFKPIKSSNLKGLRLLIKAKGKCTTDHISMAGPCLLRR